MEKYFRKARDAAFISDFARTHVGCVAVYKNTIIGVGFNVNKTHPMQKMYNRYRDMNKNKIDPVPKLHAEIMCLNSISKMNIDFSKVHLYIFRIRKDIGHGIARPCPACMQAIVDFGIKNIHYTTDYGFAYETIGGTVDEYHYGLQNTYEHKNKSTIKNEVKIKK